MRAQWAAAAGALIVFLLAPQLLSGQPERPQPERPQPRVIGPKEGHIQVQTNGIQAHSKVGSLSTGASKLTLGVGTIPPGVATPTHLHEIDEELLYVLEGEITVTLDGKESTVGPGGTVFVPPGTWMAIANRSKVPAVALGIFSRGEVEHCMRVLMSRDSDDAARREAHATCRMQHPEPPSRK